MTRMFFAFPKMRFLFLMLLFTGSIFAQPEFDDDDVNDEAEPTVPINDEIPFAVAGALLIACFYTTRQKSHTTISTASKK